MKEIISKCYKEDDKYFNSLKNKRTENEELLDLKEFIFSLDKNDSRKYRSYILNTLLSLGYELIETVEKINTEDWTFTKVLNKDLKSIIEKGENINIFKNGEKVGSLSFLEDGYISMFNPSVK